MENNVAFYAFYFPFICLGNNHWKIVVVKGNIFKW